MSSNAFSGVGSEFRRYSGASWSKIAEVNSISGPGMSREMIDVTSLDSTGGYREFIPSFRDGGQVTLNMNFTRDGYEELLSDYESDSEVDYEIVLSDSEKTTIEFTGYVQELPITISTDDKVGNDCTIKVTGQVTVNSGSGSGA